MSELDRMNIVNTKMAILGAIVRGAFLGLLLTGIFIGGFWFRGTPAAARFSPPPDTTSAVGSYPLITQIQGLLNNNFLRDQPDQKQLEVAAARGMLSALNDKYTFLVDAPVAHSESDVLAGKYGGIGVLVQRDEVGNFALYPFPDSPALQAGVEDGDLLLEVNNTPLPLSTQEDAVDQMLRGEVKDDNGVAIEVKRPSTGKEIRFNIVFQEIDIPSVVCRRLREEPTFGYIQILRFTNRTPEETRTAVKDLTDKHVKALVLDMRNNPGGLLQEAVDVSGGFLDGGWVVHERSPTSEDALIAPKSDVSTELPMAVLINKDTASAAELVAGALHDRKRATVIGQQSYGKGTVQLLFPLFDQSSLHVTTAEWLSPNRIPINGKGITPDIPMIPDANGSDVELGEAIHFLRDGKS